MARKAYDLTFVLRSPFLFEGLALASHGFDASALRDEEHHIIIPGDHVRGHLRHAVAAMHGVDDPIFRALFGRESDAVDTTVGGEQNKPMRGALIIGDLKGPRAADTGIYHRVKIDPATGAADRGMLQLIELTAPIGADVTFSGRLVLRPYAQVTPDVLEATLTAALKLIPAMGALKSAGFGEVIHENCKLSPDSTALPVVVDPGGDRVSLTIRFDRPILVDSKRDSSNSFTSATVIPGGAFKGALALALADAGMDVKADAGFSALRASHAFPLSKGVLADRALPDALMSALSDDGSLSAASVFQAGALARLSAVATPAFPMDWKSSQFKAARKALKRPDGDLSRYPRGRVGIGSDGLAEEAKLFVVESIGARGREWQMTLDFTSVPALLRQKIFAELSGGLDGLGRTGARLEVTEAVAAPAHGVSPKVGETVYLMLETPAVLTDPTDDTAVSAQYARYFAQYGGATLKDHVARRRLAGEYYGYRFRGYGKALYQPFEVTEGGAVFALEVTDPDKFAQLLQAGLPPVRWHAGSLSELTWDVCPFVPENGYGAVSLIPDVLDVWPQALAAAFNSPEDEPHVQ